MPEGQLIDIDLAEAITRVVMAQDTANQHLNSIVGINVVYQGNLDILREQKELALELITAERTFYSLLIRGIEGAVLLDIQGRFMNAIQRMGDLTTRVVALIEQLRDKAIAEIIVAKARRALRLLEDAIVTRFH